MRKAKKLLAVLAALCLLMSFAVVSVAAEATFEYTGIEHDAVGTYRLDVLRTVDHTVYSFAPQQAGVYKITTTTSGAKLYNYGGSAFYQYYIGEAERNTITVQWKESQVGGSIMFGISCPAAKVVVKIERDANAEVEVDIGELPWTMYETTAVVEDFTLDLADDQQLEYVDVTAPHTAVLGDDGYYHLDDANGEILYVNLGNDAPYISLINAQSYGFVRYYVYDDAGEFVDKIDFNDCLLEYYEASDNGIYPMTADLIEMMQALGESMGWYDMDRTNGSYLFGENEIDEATGWMCTTCYVPGSASDDEPDDEPDDEDPTLGTMENPLQLLVDAGSALIVELAPEEVAWIQVDDADGSAVYMFATDDEANTAIEGFYTQYGMLNLYFPDGNGDINFTMTGADMFYVGNDSDKTLYVWAFLSAASDEDDDEGEDSPYGTFYWSDVPDMPLSGNGGMMDPFVIEIDGYDMGVTDVYLMTDYSGEEADVYFHSFTAPEDGTIYVEIDTDFTEVPWQYAINNITSGTYGDMHWSDDDDVISREEIKVAAGDELQIIMATYDAADMWNYPAGHIEWNLGYASSVGAADNPELIEESGDFTAVVTEEDAYTYAFIAEEDGTITVTMNSENWTYVIIKNALDDMIASSSVLDDAVASSTMEVKAGDVVAIAIAITAENGEDLVAGEVEWSFTFEGVPGSSSNPITFIDLKNDITVPAGATMYYKARFTGLVGTLTGGEATLVENGEAYTTENGALTFTVTGGDVFNWPVFAVTNTGDEDATYSLNFDYELGSRENPIALDDISEIVYEQVAGDSDGVYYVWTATSTGTLQMSIKDIAAGSQGEIVLNGTKWLRADGVDGVLSLEVTEGDEISISLAIGMDGDGNYYPAGTMKVAGAVVTTGDDNTGDDNTGDDNTGDDNTGDDNTGDDNTGDDNTGDDNTGDDNTGDDNTGDDNTGDDNTGDDNQSSPVTGDSGMAGLAAVLLLFSASVLVLLKKRTVR